ncbi:MAG: hypothetical protein KKA36_07940 [Gammaproteobacteria bacterium]|nr:hypothetical protein [Gammaproteobacteria bacterium]MBU2479008.1 hypothetical protein [Gammaproteobacteria bacterium]
MSWVLPDVDPFLLVTRPAPPPLAGWYAAPMAPALAAELHSQARQAQQRQLADQGSLLASRLMGLIAGFWQDRAIDLDYRSLLATVLPEQQALVELVYGQLLISRKLSGAQDHLKRGFILATPMLKPAEYFAVLRCHEMLSSLVLTERPSVAQTLPSLLNEARVIKQLQPAGRRHMPSHRDDDTLG